MAYYAIIETGKNVIVEVNTGVDEMITQTTADGTEVGGSTEAWEQFYTTQLANPNLYVKRTSYNAATTGYRGCYAGVGYTFDASLGANGEFVPPVLTDPIEPIDEP
jgi:hypothetical protein